MEQDAPNDLSTAKTASNCLRNGIGGLIIFWLAAALIFYFKEDTLDHSKLGNLEDYSAFLALFEKVWIPFFGIINLIVIWKGIAASRAAIEISTKQLRSNERWNITEFIRQQFAALIDEADKEYDRTQPFELEISAIIRKPPKDKNINSKMHQAAAAARYDIKISSLNDIILNDAENIDRTRSAAYFFDFFRTLESTNKLRYNCFVSSIRTILYNMNICLKEAIDEDIKLLVLQFIAAKFRAQLLKARQIGLVGTNEFEDVSIFTKLIRGSHDPLEIKKAANEYFSKKHLLDPSINNMLTKIEAFDHYLEPNLEILNNYLVPEHIPREYRKAK